MKPNLTFDLPLQEKAVVQEWFAGWCFYVVLFGSHWLK